MRRHSLELKTGKVGADLSSWGRALYSKAARLRNDWVPALVLCTPIERLAREAPRVEREDWGVGNREHIESMGEKVLFFAINLRYRRTTRQSKESILRETRRGEVLAVGCARQAALTARLERDKRRLRSLEERWV